MKRLIDYHLLQWKNDPYRKALILRGARQVGKTYAVRELGKSFTHFVEVNFEKRPDLHSIFEKNLIPERIIQELSIALQLPILPGETLLFFDEIQAYPTAITSLRYFYENMPELHVVAAGSLLNFAIDAVGIPVGRVESLYVYPLSFLEFLAALGKTQLIEAILMQELSHTMPEIIHADALSLVGEYLALGGMPMIVKCWKNIKDPLRCTKEISAILNHYRQDFQKYAKNQKQENYLEMIFDELPRQLCGKFRYSTIEGDYRTRDLVPALNKLVKAGVAHKIYYSSGHKIPLGHEIDPKDYKMIMLDVGLTQAELKSNLSNWFINPVQEFSNKGHITEAFVGQEILAYSSPFVDCNLYYWRKKDRGASAEIDYLFEKKEHVIPLEVKAGTAGRLKSMHAFLETHPKCPYGIRFSAHNYSAYQQVHSFPLYAIAKVVAFEFEEVRRSIEALLTP